MLAARRRPINCATGGKGGTASYEGALDVERGSTQHADGVGLLPGGADLD